MKKAWAVVALLALSCGAFAREDPRIVVQAAGSVKVTPTALELWVTLKEKAPDAAAAAEALTKAQAECIKKLTAANIKHSDLKSELPRVVDAAAQASMRSRRSGGRLKRKAAGDEKPEVELQQLFRVLLPLTAKEPAAMVIEAEALKAKVKEAKLINEAAANEGEEEENYGQPPPSALVFQYYAPRSDTYRGQALADALKKAAEVAQLAATATGKPKPVVHSLTLQTERTDEQQQYQYNRYNGYENYVAPPVEDGLTSQTPQISVFVQVSVEFSF